MTQPDSVSVAHVFVAGTCDTKRAELAYVRDLIAADGVPCLLVDLSTSPPQARGADISAETVAACHPHGAAAVFKSDRGLSVAAMALAFRRFIEARGDVAGLVGLGGSGNTALVTEAMRALPVGVPKLMVSTVASGNVAGYVGPSDVAMMYSVTDIAGLNRISRRVLANAAHAIAGMARARPVTAHDDRPAIGITMFGVTTACVTAVRTRLEADYDCLVFHATGTGGASMEKLADSRLLAGVIDVTTTEVADYLVGGTLACTDDRFGAVARTRLPYVGSCGALDMVNFGAMSTVPTKFRGRNLYVHNPQVTLMRTRPDECRAIGTWIGERLNRCQGDVRFLLPEGGVSAIATPGQPFYDPEADAALFAALEATVVRTPRRKLFRLPYAINDPPFADALVEQFRDAMAATAASQ
jgi:uncharacterized protein (UPF0261 family)